MKLQKGIYESVKQLFEMANIQTALNTQDELDRKWVSLFGAMEAQHGMSGPAKKDQKPEQTIFKLKADCISHSHTNMHIINLFKVACLRYKPNPVTFNEKKYNRDELISK